MNSEGRDPPPPRTKTREDYSRNVKKLKLKLQLLRQDNDRLAQRLEGLLRTNSDKLLALRLSKFCKERRMTPEMLFRFADRGARGSVARSDFRATLLALGLRLTQEEAARLEYLVDEDLSGSLGEAEYAAYLQAFGIRRQFGAGEVAARTALQALDVDRILRSQQEETGGKRREQGQKKAHLLSYEQFVKYCHRHCKQLRDRQIASIFERLQRNQLIDLQHFLDYLLQQQQQRKKVVARNEKKNKPQEPVPADPGIASLRSLLQHLLKMRGSSAGPLFHSSEFSRLERTLGRPRGQLTALFRQIDGRRKDAGLNANFRGSFGYDQLISYYVWKETGSQQLGFAYELMGAKLSALKQSAECVLMQYADEAGRLSEEGLARLMREEFGLVGSEYEALRRLLPQEVQVAGLLELMRAGSPRRLFVRPDLAAGRLVFREALSALKCCLQLVQKLGRHQREQWDDYQFGPTETDEEGLDAVGLSLPSQNLQWLRASQTGMTQFFEPGAADTGQAVVSAGCSHGRVGQAAWGLARLWADWLYPAQGPDSQARAVGPSQLRLLVQGVYPRLFHPFAKSGIFVLRIWHQERWLYVVLDDKLPCGSDSRPLFSHDSALRYSFASLLEKAMAKLTGSYASLLTGSSPDYLMHLSGALCLDASPENIWDDLLRSFALQKQESGQAKKTQLRELVLALFRGRRQLQTDLGVDLPLEVRLALGGEGERPALALLRTGQYPRGYEVWNKEWSPQGQLYQKHRALLSEAVQGQGGGSLWMPWPLLQRAFGLVRVRRVDWQVFIVLRKELQLQRGYRCRYEVTAKSTDLQLWIYLRRRATAEEHRIALEVGPASPDMLQDWEARAGKVRTREVRGTTWIQSIRLERDLPTAVEIFATEWTEALHYDYVLTFYLSHPRFELKQRDRHMLFRFVGPSQEDPLLEWSQMGQGEKQFVYREFYKAAEPKGCCGCL